MAEDIVEPIPNLKLPEYVFRLSESGLGRLHEESRRELMEGIKKDDMAPYYRLLTSGSEPLLARDEKLLEEMEKNNREEMEGFKKRLEEAEKTEGEMEISDALRKRGMYLTRIGEKDAAIDALKEALEKTPGLGAKIDITLTLARIGFFFSSNQLITDSLAQAEAFIEKGGDWDRRNRLKVYKALRFVGVREFGKAAEGFVDALSTFTASEVMDYEELVSLGVICGMVSFGRVDLRNKIIQSPEINAILPSLPTLSAFTKSLHQCHYDKFFRALGDVEEEYLVVRRMMKDHARWYVREMKVKAYVQLLESYRSLTVESLSAALGVSREFVDSDLSRYIAAGRIHATIDKVHGIVETNRPDAKSAQYETVVKQGDILLNKVQRLSKVLY